MDLFQPFETCYEVWQEACNCYANDIQGLYSIIFNMITLRQQFTKMEVFLDMARSLMEEFSAIMPYAEDLENVQQQILASANAHTVSQNPFTDYSIFPIWYHFMFLLSQLSH